MPARMTKHKLPFAIFVFKFYFLKRFIMENLKRKRERCFDNSEKAALLNIIIEHYNIIESKNTDGVSIKIKNAEWVKIAEEFSAASSMY